MTFILSRLVNPEFLVKRDFVHKQAHLQEKDKETNRKSGNGKDKVYTYYKDPFTKEHRFVDEPHQVSGLLKIFTIATAVLFTATCILRLFQLTLLFPGIFFRTFKTSFSDREKEDYSEVFYNTFEAKVQDQGTQFFIIGNSFANDMHCALAMETSALVGGFSQDMNRVLQMQVIFSEMERKWNQGKEPQNGLVAIWIRSLNHHSVQEMTLKDWKKFGDQVRKESNGSFYLYQCAQPITSELRQRVSFIEGRTFKDYQAMHEYYAQKVVDVERGME